MMMRAVIATFLILFSTLTFATVKAESDRTQVGEGESFTLTISVDGASSGEPDLSILEANFDMVGTSNSSNISIMNGQMSSQKSWQIQLIPKQVGTIIIPAISVDGEKTQPITIEVNNKPASPNQNTNNNNGNTDQAVSNAFFEATVDKHETYVQGQIIYTLRFYYRPELPITNISLDDFSIEGASIEGINTKQQPYRKELNGVIYLVSEATYAIFPENSGQLHIPARTLTIQMQNGMFAQTRTARVKSEEIFISVLPQPNHDNPWLPAKSLSLNDSWSTNPPVFKVGESVTRKITIEAEGLHQSQLPALPDMKIDGIKAYSDKPQIKSGITIDGSGIQSSRTDSTAIVVTKAGTYTLPAINIRWWNTEKNKAETTSLPAFTFTVADAPVNNQSTLPAPVVEPSAVPDHASEQPGFSFSAFSHNPWLWVACAFIVLWALTLFLWWRTALRKNNVSAVKIKPIKKETSVSIALDELTAACHSNDASKVREALLKWAMKRWAMSAISLEEIAAKAPPLSEEINALEQALYAQHTSAWQGDKLLALIKELPPVASDHNKQKSPLASLYPDK